MSLKEKCVIGCVLLLTGLGLAGCQSQKALQEAEATYARGNVEEGLRQTQELLARDPRNVNLQIAAMTMREKAVDDFLAEAAARENTDKPAEKARLYRRVLALDAANSRAQAGLEQLERETRISKALLDAQFAFDAKDYPAAALKLKSVLTEDPANGRARALMVSVQEKEKMLSAEQLLAATLQKKISIQFRDIQLRQAFDVLTQTSSINFVLDKDIKTDQKTTLSLKDVTVKDALNTLLVINQLEYRALDQNTILIYPDTPAKGKDYQTLKVKAFILANADPEQVASDLKTILKTRDMTVDKSQNMIIMRDTPEAVLVAEKIVALRDLPSPEVMLEVTVLEVNKNRLTELGIKYPNQLSLAPLPGTAGKPVTLNDLLNLDSTTVSATVPALNVIAKGEDEDIKLLANPRIRVKNRESAKILIGNRVPNITSTSTSTGFVSENVQYLDVGLKLEVSPVITVDNDVSIKVSLEVSNITSQVTTSSGTTAYQIGTRTASTVLRLRDGENQILAGLINNESHRGSYKIPLLGDIPLLGRFFSSRSNEKNETEIVLSITPRLIRNIARPDAEAMEFDSGTETSFRRTDLSVMTAAAVKTAAQQAARTPLATGLAPANGGEAGGAEAGPKSEALPETAAGTTTMTWTGDTQQRVGASFQQQLILTAAAPLSGISYVISYDPAVLSVVKVTEGGLLGQGGATTSFNQRVDAATGQIHVSNVRSAGEGRGAVAGAVGQAPLVNLVFKAVAAAKSTQIGVVSVTPVGVGDTPLTILTPSPRTVIVSP